MLYEWGYVANIVYIKCDYSQHYDGSWAATVISNGEPVGLVCSGDRNIAGILVLVGDIVLPKNGIGGLIDIYVKRIECKQQIMNCIAFYLSIYVVEQIIQYSIFTFAYLILYREKVSAP